MDKTDLSLLLSAVSALGLFAGRGAVVVIAAFIAGMLVEQHRRPTGPGP
jgi:hypothetical protein